MLRLIRVVRVLLGRSIEFLRTTIYNNGNLHEDRSRIPYMHEENVRNSIHYILQRAIDLSLSIGKTKLIKLLYLLDIEHHRAHQRTLSELNWVFYKFGPYAFEIENFLGDIGVTEEGIVLRGGRIFSRLGIDPEEEAEIDIERRAILDTLIEEWGDASLGELLDYVYFDTEPMIDVQTRGERLDFNTIKPKSYYAVKEYEVDEKRGKEIIKKIRQWELSKKGGR